MQPISKNSNINFGATYQEGLGLYNHLSRNKALVPEIEAFKKSISKDSNPFFASVGHNGDTGEYTLNVFDKLGSIGAKTFGNRSNSNLLTNLLSSYLTIIQKHNQAIAELKAKYLK